MHLLPFLSYVFVTTFTPGPNNIVAMSNAHRYGYKRTLKFMGGVAVGFLIVTVASSYFNLLLFRFVPKIKLSMSILGSIYMLYLAFKIVTSDVMKNQNAKDGKPISFVSGLGLQFINPKAILFAITLTSTFLLPLTQSNLTFAAFALFMGFVTFSANSSWAIFGTLLQRFLSKYERPFKVLMGLLLVYSAISLYV